VTDRERLLLIAKANRFCGTVVTREALRSQFRYEVGTDPESRDLDYVTQKWLSESR
jgi:hypothetical protein